MHRLVLAGLLPVLFAIPGAAGGGAGLASRGDEPPIVTEAEFLSALDDSHPAVVERMAALAVARSRIVAASAWANPVLEAVREDPSGPSTQTEWALSWQLPGAGRRPVVAARREAADAAAARLSQQLLALRLAMKEVYAVWAVASTRHDLLATQTERVKALADRQRLRAQRGEASGLEARRLELAAGLLRTRVALAAGAAERARAEAAGWHATLPPDARPLLPPVPPAPDPREDHPLVRAAERDLAAATLERQAAGRFVRSPEVSFGWQRQEAAGETAGGPILGVAWPVPVFARNRGERAASEARMSSARARLERTRREIEAARIGATSSFRRLVTALAAAEQDLDGNERMLDGAAAAFRLGDASLTDLLETHRTLTESELAVLELHQAALAAHRDLERAAGVGPSVPTLHSQLEPQEDPP